ncbi:MAG: hypothetical protein E7160_00060 [Firmicutes bacterium]|nr:hypothetical protein [Bacillota bacterium]
MKKNRIIIYFVLVIFFTLFNFYFRPISKNEQVTEEYKKSSAYINKIYKSNEYFKKNIIKNKEEEKVYNQVINDIKANKTTAKIKCKTNCADYYQDIVNIIYLDHPELIKFQSMRWRFTDSSNIESSYTNLDPLRTFFGTLRIEREIDAIKRETKNMDDKDKIIYVYDYIASHNYDHLFTYSSSNQSAYSFFSKKSSVCASFAKTAQLIFQNIGIESYGVLNNEHMWNYVKYDNKYYVFDATVGASYSEKSSPNFYDGLGKTTVDAITGYYPVLYPPIEQTPLKEIFGL